jgi:hypothetical protein
MCTKKVKFQTFVSTFFIIGMGLYSYFALLTLFFIPRVKTKSASFMLNKSSKSLNKRVTQSFIPFLGVISAYLYYDVSSNCTLFLDRFPLYTVSYIFSS